MLTYGYVRNTGSQNLAISLLESHADGARLYNESQLPLEYTYKLAPRSPTGRSCTSSRCTRTCLQNGAAATTTCPAQRDRQPPRSEVQNMRPMAPL